MGMNAPDVIHVCFPYLLIAPNRRYLSVGGGKWWWYVKFVVVVEVEDKLGVWRSARRGAE